MRPSRHQEEDAMNGDVNSQQVIVFTRETAQEAPGGLESLGGSSGGVTTVGALRESIDALLPGLDAIISDIKAKAAAAGLEDVTVALGINAKGRIGFLGTGSEIGGTASLTLKFKVKG
jgi:hypothetical protein